MIPGPFAYHRPASLEEAIGLLGQHGDEAKILAGGQSLIPLMRFRFAEPAQIIDINRIAGLDGISEENGYLKIGALARESALDRSQLVRQRYPLLADTAKVIADPIVRNLATVGGNLAHADPANDHPATMLAYRAELVARGPDGERVIPIDEFFAGPFEPALNPGEILTEIRIPAPGARSGGAYEKFERKVGDYAVSAAAVQLSLAEDGTVASAGVATTNVSFELQRCAAAEEVLLGRQPDEAAIREAAQAAADAADPTSDLRGPAEYKRAVTRTVTRRALHRALERARANA
ncbi:MAG TPA: xanthine dehydrogenase family protein subunit M [Thermomicrobiales bacterium]|nr:xanthine dehydrogenase family protein subunit M [Thermomicrobiales bacterium]